MRKYWDAFTRLAEDKKYRGTVGLAALVSYGFFVTHGTVGIDDTPYAYYFEEGLAAIVGRWVLFLLNKVLQIAEYAPFLTDLAGVLLLLLAVTAWCALFYRILGEHIPMYGYYVFAATMLSCPLLSEVLPYFLHNGIGIGYLLSGVSLWCYHGGLESENRKRRVLCFLGSSVLLVVALGCYESFMIVWLAGVLLLLFSERLLGNRRNPVKALLAVIGIAGLGMVLRSLMIAGVTVVFGLEGLKEAAVQRSLTELAGWLLEEGALAEFAMVLKRTVVMYGVFAYAYLPIRIFVLAALVMLVTAVGAAIRRKDVWIVLLYAGVFVSCFLLIVIEGKATLYRSAQFLPLICGYGMLLLVGLAQLLCRSRWLKGSGKLQKILRKTATGVVMAVCGVVLWNQCADMNRWFYVDYLKYEDAKNTMHQIAYELEKEFDTDKPIVFTGEYLVPREIIQGAYVSYQSDTFYRMNRITSRIDEHLLEKFYREYGVWVAQTPSLSVLNWAKYAFDNNEELIRFFAMHGYELVPMLDETVYPEAEEYSLQLPSFPEEGSIVDRGEYIIVHF